MSAYSEAVLDFRRRKDEHFAAGQGPIQGEALENFTGLSYFAPNEAWGFDLPLEAAEAGHTQEFALATNSGATRYMALLGFVAVPMNSTEHRLSVFAPLGEDRPARVFIPFKDATSGKQTYGAGRYLDAPVTYTADEALVRVDFNLAYHPYCAYGDDWTCPLPPAENVLPEAILAGERLA